MSYSRDPFSTPEPQTSFQPYSDLPTHSNPDNQDYFDAAAIPVSDSRLVVLKLRCCSPVASFFSLFLSLPTRRCVWPTSSLVHSHRIGFPRYTQLLQHSLHQTQLPAVLIPYLLPPTQDKTSLPHQYPCRLHIATSIPPHSHTSGRKGTARAPAVAASG